MSARRPDTRRRCWSAGTALTTGLLLGWTPIVKGATRRRARESLDEFMAKRG